MGAIKKIAAVLLAALLIIPAEAVQEDKTFSDVPAKHWAAESIQWAAYYGLMEGTGGQIFGLGQDMTRASYMTALCRLMGWEMLHPETGSFVDNQNPKKWYYSAIETAYAHEVLTDQSELCRPNDTITREEMAIMTIRALGYATLAGIVAEDCPFTDVFVGRGYIALAYHMGIVKGVGASLFHPKETATREEAAVVLLRTYRRIHAEVTVTEGAAPEGVSLVQSIEDAENALSPRVPLENVYAAAVANNETSLAFCAVPYAQEMRGDIVAEGGRELTQAELNAVLANKSVQLHRSTRYQSSCAFLSGPDGATTIVWFESEEDIAAKLALCRLLGVETVYLVK